MTEIESPQKVMAAVVQMNSGDDYRVNLEHALSLLRAAAQEGAGLVVLPENFLCFGHVGLGDLSAALGKVTLALQQCAKEFQVNIVAGSIPHAPSDSDHQKHLDHQKHSDHQKYYSRSLLMDSSGHTIAQYDKVHLFDVDVADQHARYRESDTYLSGTDSEVANVSGIKLGMTICYDLRFPKLYQALLAQAAEVLTVPAAFTAVTGKAHWEILLRARAIETQCFVLAANQVGDHGKGRQTWGHSMIIDPWGEVLAECEDGPGFVCAELDFARLRDIRKAIPVQAHTRNFSDS